MAPRYALEIVDRNLKSIMNNDLPFGCEMMVLCGDFRQLLPIKINGTIKNSILWNHFSTFNLKTNRRTSRRNRIWNIFNKCFLINVGDGTLNDQNNCIELP